MRKVLIVLVLALVFTLAGAVGLATRDRAPDVVPAAATVQPVQIGTGQDYAALIDQLDAQLRRLPEDHRTWAQLAVACVEQARLTADLTYYERAEEAVARSLAIQPDDNFSALSASAALAAARHEFPAALRDAEQALAINGYEPAALAVRVDALTELGRYDAQLAALEEADRRQPGVPIAARYAYALELRGDLDRAADVLGTAAESADRSGQSFLFTLLADVRRRQGDLPASAAALRRAEEADPTYLEALVSRARLALARGDLDAGLRLWERAVERAPDIDHRIELGELYLHFGRDADARTQLDAAAESIRVAQADGQAVEHEIAIFEADHGSPDVAVRAARVEWDRRHSIHIADALAWALHRAGDDRAALRYARAATRLGSGEPLLWLHRGTIEAALGQTAEARRHLTRGLALDPGISPWQRAQAADVLASLAPAGG